MWLSMRLFLCQAQGHETWVILAEDAASSTHNSNSHQNLCVFTGSFTLS